MSRTTKAQDDFLNGKGAKSEPPEALYEKKKKRKKGSKQISLFGKGKSKADPEEEGEM
jgi:hypothetical protein